MITGMIYGELPLAAVMPREGRTTQLETGDVAYWPAPGAFCIFYGPTPLSGEDGKPVSPYPVIKIGHIDGDCSALDGAGDRMKIILDPIYRFGARARICSRRMRPSLWGPRIPGRSTRQPPAAWTRAWPGRA